jgi:site-specific DNA-cytosine methylase
MDETEISEERLFKAAEKLKKISVNLSKLAKEAAAIVADFRSNMDPQLAETLLEVRAGLSRDDVALFESLAKVAMRNSGLPEEGVSIETLRMLAHVDDDVRADAIAAIAAGTIVGKAELSRIESHRKWARTGGDQPEADARAASLESIAAAKARDDILKTESLAQNLIDQLRAFEFSFAADDFDEEPEHSRDKEFTEAFEDIRSGAGGLLELVERVLGRPGSLQVTVAAIEFDKLADAYSGLQHLASASFKKVGGRAVADFSPFKMIHAIDYLCAPVVAVEDAAPIVRPDHKLRVLELAAGVGGQAIGLMAAGFTHTALYEVNWRRVKTLKANWPEWKVHRKDLLAIPVEEYARYQGIDLLAGSLARMVVADEDESDDDSDALSPTPCPAADLSSEMMRAISIVKPRAFVLESGRSLAFKEHATNLAVLSNELKDLGYGVTVMPICADVFGLPQTVQRSMIVGIRHGEPGAFVRPALKTPLDRSVADVLAELVILHETPPELKHLVEFGSPQYRYNEWAGIWRSLTSDKKLKAILAKPERRKEAPKKGIEVEGFNGYEFAAQAPTIEEVQKNSHYKPKMTLEMLARAQGFPPGWTFRTNGDGRMKMVADSCPPVLARVVGLQIYSALTGLYVDLDAALATPMIAEHKIGRSPPVRLNSRIPPDVIDKVEILIRKKEFLALGPGVSNRRKRVRELIKDVEPDYLRRPIVMEAAERALSDYLWDSRCEEEEERVLFPHDVP